MQRLRLFLFVLLYVSALGGGSTYAQTNGVKWVWAKAPSKGDPSSQIVTQDVKADDAGNQFVTGYYYGTVDFGNGASISSVVSAGQPTKDAFVAKYDRLGALKWLKTIGSNNDDEGLGIAINPNNLDVYITGYLGGTASLGNLTRTPQGNHDLFAAKIDQDGIVQWYSILGGSDNDAGADITVDPVSGDAYVTGYVTAQLNASVSHVSQVNTGQFTFAGTGANNFSPNVVLPGGSLDPNSGYIAKNKDVYVGRLAGASGAWLWHNTLGLPNRDDWANGVNLFELSPGVYRIYLTGAINDGLNGQTVPAEAASPNFRVLVGSNPFVAKSNANTQSANVLYGDADVFVAAIENVGGSSDWHAGTGVIAGGSKDDEGSSIDLDRIGNVYITGYYRDVVEFGRGNTVLGEARTAFGTPNSAVRNHFVAQYTSAQDAGNWNQFGWAASAGSGSDAYGSDLVVSKYPDTPTGTIYVSGNFRSSPCNFSQSYARGSGLIGVLNTQPQHTLDNTGGTNAYDSYVAKYNPEGILYWTRDITVCDGDDKISAIAQNTKQEVFVSINYDVAPLTLDLFDYPSVDPQKFVLAEIKDRVSPSWQGANKPANGAFSNDIHVDADGNIYVTGRFNNTVNFAINGLAGAADAANPATVTSKGNSDYFVAKYNSSQQLVWLRTAGGTSNDEGYSLVVDAANNVYVVGYFQGNNVAFGPQPWQAFSSSSNFRDGFVIKYDAAGSLTGYVKVNGDRADEIRDVAIDPSGIFLYVTGYFTTTGGNAAWFENTPTVTLNNTTPANVDVVGALVPSQRSAFTAKIRTNTSNGSIAPNKLEWLWATATPSATSYSQGNGIAVSDANNIYVAGTSVMGSFEQAVLYKYDEQGNAPQWASVNGPADAAGVAANNNAQGISVAVYGSQEEYVYFVGNFIDNESANSITYFRDGNAPFAATANIAEAIPGGNVTSDKDVFIAKYLKDGQFQWVAEMGSKNGEDDVYRVITNEIGNPYILGYVSGSEGARFYDAYRLDPISHPNNQNKDLFLAEYDQTGLLNWVTNVLCSGNDEAKGIALDKYYSIYLTGNYDGSDLTIGDDVLAGPPNNSGFFITKNADAIQTGTQIFANTGVQNYRVCAGTTDVVQFVPQGTFQAEANNVYTVELSDPNGNFNTNGMKVIGTLASAASPANIDITIPEDQVYGVKYRIRVRSSAPALTALDNGTDITIDPKPLAAITGANEFCAGGSVVLTAVNTNLNLVSPGTINDYDYQWMLNGVNVGANSNTIVVDDASVGSYTVKITRKTTNVLTSNLTCDDVSDAHVVVSNPLPVPVISVANTITGGTGTAADPKRIYVCPGESVDFGVNEFASYLWANNQSTQNITATQTGVDYYVDVTDAKGCTARSEYYRLIQVNIPSPVITSVGSTQVCEGGVLALNAPAADPALPAAYQWFLNGVAIPGANASSYSAFAVDTLDENVIVNYTVVLTQGSCVTTSDALPVTFVNSDIFISFNGQPASAAAPVFYCEATTFDIVASGDYTSYQWFKDGVAISGANTNVYQGTEQGSYTVQYQTNPNVCGLVTSETIQVIANAIPTASIASSGVAPVDGVKYFCESENVTLTAEPAGANYSYEWFLNGASAGTGASISVNTGSAGDYSLIVTDNATGCSSLSSDVLALMPVATPTPGVSLWVNGEQTQANAGSGSLNDPFVINLCPGQSLTLLADSGYVAYNWSTGNNTQSISRSDAGIYFVSVDQNTNGVVCSGQSLYYSLQYPTPPVAEIFASSSTGTTIANAVINICGGDSIKLAAFVPSGQTYNFLWERLSGSAAVSVSDQQAIWVKSNGDYRVTVWRAGESCPVVSAVRTLNVLATSSFDVELIGASEICAGDSTLSLNAGGGYDSYQWYSRQIFDGGSTPFEAIAGATGQFYYPTESGLFDFKVVVSSQFCGQNVESTPTRVKVNLLPAKPTVTVTPNVAAPLIPSFVTITVIDSVPGFKYIYSLGGQEEAISDFASYTSSKGGNWSVTVVNEAGCTATTEFFVLTDVAAAISAIDNVNIYPNPTSSIITIDANLNSANDFKVEVVNMVGQVLVSNSTRANAGLNTQTVDLSNFAAGVYTVRIHAGSQIMTKKVVKN